MFNPIEFMKPVCEILQSCTDRAGVNTRIVWLELFTHCYTWQNFWLSITFITVLNSFLVLLEDYIYPLPVPYGCVVKPVFCGRYHWTIRGQQWLWRKKIYTTNISHTFHHCVATSQCNCHIYLFWSFQLLELLTNPTISNLGVRSCQLQINICSDCLMNLLPSIKVALPLFWL